MPHFFRGTPFCLIYLYGIERRIVGAKICNRILWNFLAGFFKDVINIKILSPYGENKELLGPKFCNWYFATFVTGILQRL